MLWDRWVVSILIVSLFSNGTAYSEVATPIEQVQNGLRQQQAALNELQTSIDELRSQNSLLKDMMKSMIATQAAANQLSIQKNQTPDQVKAELEKLKSRAKDASDFVAKIPTTSIPQALKDRLGKCVTDAYSASEAEISSVSKDPSKILAACPDAQNLLGELNSLKDKATNTWKVCRSVLVDLKTVQSKTLPQDINGLSTSSMADLRKKVGEIEELTKNANASARDCAKTMKETIEQVTDQEKVAAAVGLTLAFASQVCLSSGGNPYVCGGIFLLSVLMSLFGDKGGGGGKGDDKGQGDGESTGFGVGMSGRSGEIGPIKGALPGGGNFGNFNGGRLACNSKGKVLNCWLTAQPDNVLVFNPEVAVTKESPIAKELADAVESGKSDRVQFCLSDSNDLFVRGLLLFAAENYRAIDVVRPDVVRLRYPPPADVTMVKGRNAGQLCSDSFK